MGLYMSSSPYTVHVPKYRVSRTLGCNPKGLESTWTCKKTPNNGLISQNRGYRQYQVHCFGAILPILSYCGIPGHYVWALWRSRYTESLRRVGVLLPGAASGGFFTVFAI